MAPTARISLETERLILRRFVRADVENLVELDGDGAVMRFLTGGEPTPREEIEDGILPKLLREYERSPDFGRWAATGKPTGEFLGWLELQPATNENTRGNELGYRLKKSAWGKGYATEGSKALIHKGFTELGARRVFAQTMAVNLASRRVMERIGLKHVRTFHEDWQNPIEGAEHGEVEYALRREEWENRKS